MENNEYLIEAVKGLGELLKDKDLRIYILEGNKEHLEREINRLTKEVEEWKKAAQKNLEREEEMENLRARVYELEERLAIMLGDNEGPMPMCEEFPKTGDVTEVTNITKVLEGVTE